MHILSITIFHFKDDSKIILPEENGRKTGFRELLASIIGGKNAR